MGTYTRKLLLVNRNLIGPSRLVRRTRWQLTGPNANINRGHPMVSRKQNFPADKPQNDYFRRSMCRYYAWLTGGGPGNYDNFGYLLPASTMNAFADQGGKYWSIGFEIKEPGTLVIDNPIRNIVESGNFSPVAYSLLFGPYSTVSAIFGAPLTTPNPYGPVQYRNVGHEFIEELKIHGADQAWLQTSNTNGITNFARELFNEPGWYNWQAYILGDNAITFDGAARRFPGILGTGMINKLFYDHAFEVSMPNSFPVSSNYNYSNEFFDTIATNPYVTELYIPNLYTISSVLYGAGGYFYDNLFLEPRQSPIYDAAGNQVDWGGGFDVQSATKLKTLMRGTVASALPGYPDRLESATVGPGLDEIPATSQLPNSILSRFTRKSFSGLSTGGQAGLLAAQKANTHIGLPYRLIVGPNSYMSDMNGHRGLFPYSVSFNFSGTGSEFLKHYADENPDDDPAGMYDLFLFEIMKANIMDFVNNPSPNFYPEDNIYEELDFSGVLDPSLGGTSQYYGFDWTATADLFDGLDAAASAAAKNPYTLRTIDLAKMFANMFRYDLNENIEEGIYATDGFGLGLASETYNSYIGQSMSKNVVGGLGLIIGKMFNSDAVPGVLNDDLVWNSLYRTGFDDTEDFLSSYIEMSDKTTEMMRPYGAILAGAKAPSDTLVYKVDKHSVTPEGLVSPKMQSFYFPNVEGAIEYVDTQVFFGKQYKYKFYAYELVIGNQYKYVNAQVYPPIEEKYPNYLSHVFYGNQVFNRVTTGHPSLVEQLPWSATGPGGKLRIEGVGSSHNDAQLKPCAVIDTEYASYIDLTVDGHRAGLALHPDAQITLSDHVNCIGVLDGYTFAAALESALNYMVSNYFLINNANYVAASAGAPGPSPDDIKFLNEFRVRFEKADGVGYLWVGTVAHLLHGGRGSAWQKLFVASFPGLTDVDPGPSDWNWTTNPFPMGFMADYGSSASTWEHAGSANLYETYFDLWRGSHGEGVPNASTVQDAIDNLGSVPELDMSIDFKTGAHGWAPQIPWNLDEEGTATTSVWNFKSCKIVEVPIGETGVIQVSDLPPQVPDVDIYPLKGSNREIKILLSSNYTRASYNTIEIEPGDAAIFETVRGIQGRTIGSPILFGSDDTSNTMYQVFRTTEKPTSYADFAGTLRYTKEAVTPEGKRVESTSILDNIDPNVYYYYCFRSIDKNNYISNPSPVLKVQMVDDNGRIYPIIEPYDFVLTEPRSTEKPFKRYLEIDASLNEKMIHPQPPGNTSTAGDPYIAPTSVGVGDKIWGSSTQFKVRVISKDTGRKIDLNLNFNVQAIPNPNLPGN